jgi:hypothetical protein
MNNEVEHLPSRWLVVSVEAATWVVPIAAVWVLSIPADKNGNHWGGLSFLLFVFYTPVLLLGAVLTVAALMTKKGVKNWRWASVIYNSLAIFPSLVFLVIGASQL